MSLHLCPNPKNVPRVNPTVNYGCGVIAMCQCRSISCNKCATLVGDGDDGGGHAGVGVGGL